MAANEHIGKLPRFISYTHSAGAMLLLVLPAYNTAHQACPDDNDIVDVFTHEGN
jgi:hypothetical protein